ncbi:MAG: hypothetical protein NTW14_02195 [bacterium]|nr:hypothetical protein [bacterium]
MSKQSQDSDKMQIADSLPDALIKALVQSTDLIKTDLTQGKLEAASQELKKRETIIMELDRYLQSVNHVGIESETTQRCGWKDTLTDLMSRNQDTIRELKKHLATTKGKVDLIRKGRKALRLYRKPNLGQPHYFSIRG